MKEKLLLSINPIHVKNILNGSKKYEYRTKVAKRPVESILIYETCPIKRVVAEVEVIDIIKLKPDDLWKETGEFSGVTKKFFDSYFKNREYAFAYKLGKITSFDEPVELSHYGVKFPPQSYAYVAV